MKELLDKQSKIPIKYLFSDALPLQLLGDGHMGLNTIKKRDVSKYLRQNASGSVALPMDARKKRRPLLRRFFRSALGKETRVRFAKANDGEEVSGSRRRSRNALINIKINIIIIRNIPL